MIRNILLVTCRNLFKSKVYTAINIIGLALGIAAFVLIGAYVRFERSYDSMHRGADNIYRVESRFYKGDQMTDDWATSTNGYAKAIKDNMAGIASFTRINWSGSERVVRYNDIKNREEHVCFADSNFFSFFSYPLLKGDKETVLKDVNTMAISESAARKYFGAADPIGRFMEISTQSHSYRCMVTGVFRDIPANSTMQFNFLLSWPTSPAWLKDTWYMHESYTFLQLQPGINPATLEAQFPALAERYKTGPAFKDLKWAIQLVPLRNMHFNPAKAYEIEPVKGNRYTTGMLNILSYVILIIAFVNYINLATTKSIDRAREVGIRKVSGARPWQLVLQFLFESFLLNGIAVLLAAILVMSSFSWVPALLNHAGSGGLLFDKGLYAYTALILLTGTLLSGIYPAMVLVRLKPMTVLKGRFSFSIRGAALRRGMVAFQFIASLLLIAGTLGIYRQIHYMGSQSIGANVDQTLVLKAPVRTNDYAQKMESLKAAIQAIPGVGTVTASGGVPGKEIAFFYANRRYGASKSEERMYEMLRVDHAFINAYGLELVAGRGFDKSRPADSSGLVLNESAVKQFGFSSAAAAIGQKVWIETLDKHPDEIIGVVRDYHQQSLQHPYTPIILFMEPGLPWLTTNYFSVKMNTDRMPDKLDRLKATWNGFFPESPFDFFFLDDFYNRQYFQEIRFGHSFMLFSSLAILIACMGLFGLTAYATARRRKEIGVRKVLGASVAHIVSMLSWSVIRMILICGVIAIPVAAILIRQWLNGFAFRAPLTWWQFLAPVLALVVIALLTTGWLTVKAALSNPATTLKDE